MYLLRVLAVLLPPLATALVSVGAAGAAQPRPDRPEPRLALVIGNGRYRPAPLPRAADQAREVARALRSCGFEVKSRTDCGRKAVEAEVRWLVRKLRERGGIGVLYYAGYAAQVEGRSLLVPVDARLEAQEGLAAGGIGLGELLQSLQEAGNRANVLFLDAVPAARAGVGLVAVPGNCRLALSDQPDRPADPDRPTGAFTAALLKYLRAPGLELETMLRYVRRDVVEATSGQQVPWDSAPLPEPFHLVPAPWDSADGPPIPKALPVGPDYAYVLAVHLGGMWPLAHDLGRTFSATDARLLSAPAPLLELRLWRRLQEVGVPDLGLSALLAWPKTRPATSLPAGHTGLLAGVLGTAEWTVPLGLGRRDPYLAAGGGAWLIKFRRTRVREALHLNPTARLGLGARIHAVGRGVLRVEACYFPLKGPTYLVESGAVCLQYALPF